MSGQVIYSLFGKPRPFFNSVLGSSRRFAKVPVQVMDQVSEEQRRLFVQLRQITDCPYELDAAALLRWLVIYEAAKTWGPNRWPIFAADWDMMACGDLRPMFELTKDADLCFTEDDNGARGIAQVFHTIEPLKAYCELLLSMIADRDSTLKTTNDMTFWHLVARKFGFKTEVINVLGNGDVVDHNLACGADRYEMVPSGLHPMWDKPLRKNIVYHEGRAYFLNLKGERVKPVVIHFWGPLKSLAIEVAGRLA